VTSALLLTADPAVARDACASGPDSAPAACRDAAALAERLAEAPARLVLLDLEPDPAAALSVLASLAARFPEARFVVLCRELTAEVLLSAMQAGARHGVRRDNLAAELPAMVQRFGRAPVRGGRLVTLLSASGGCGCTTVAISVAEELRQSLEAPVLLVDLDTDYGAAAPYLGVKGVYGVADVLARTGPIDAQLVRSTATSYGDDFKVLLSPAAVNPADPAALEWRRLPELLEAVGQAAPAVVFDAARVPPASAAELVRASALTLLVMELAVVDIRTACAMLRALEERGASLDQVVPVANRWTRRQASPTLQDARDALGREVATISNDFPAALRALNHGSPVARSSPRSPLCEDVRRLVGSLLPAPAAVAARGR